MSRRTLAALAAVNAGGWIALASHWMSDRRRLHEAEAELDRLRRDHHPPPPPSPHLRSDSDMASEWEQAVAPMDS
jgi:hypothetical protein